MEISKVSAVVNSHSKLNRKLTIEQCHLPHSCRLMARLLWRLRRICVCQKFSKVSATVNSNSNLHRKLILENFILYIIYTFHTTYTFHLVGVPTETPASAARICSKHIMSQSMFGCEHRGVMGHDFAKSSTVKWRAADDSCSHQPRARGTARDSAHE